MDIDLLSKMVKELILDNDRVVLPGLGSFVAEIVPSTFSDKGYTINPPYRRMHFRARPDEGNELIEFYASENGLDMAVAERIIRDFTSDLKDILHSKKAVVLPGLGRLRATKENNIFFVADENLNIYPAGFGLEPISLKTHQETKEEVTAAVEGLRSILEETVPAEPETEVIEPETVMVPEITVEPEIMVVPEITVDPEIIVAPEVTVEPEIIRETPKKTVLRTLLTIFWTIIAIVFLLLATLAIVGRTYPEWIDRLLYTPEELKILNQIL